MGCTEAAWYGREDICSQIVAALGVLCGVFFRLVGSGICWWWGYGFGGKGVGTPRRKDIRRGYIYPAAFGRLVTCV
jgi:hypothetical protein